MTAPSAPAEIAIVVPTFKEIGNVEEHFRRLGVALQGIAWEAVYVDDDSPDGTSAKLREMAQRDPRLRIIHRVGRRGLASAVIEGILSTSAPYVAVIDCDLQHDETILPKMLATLKSDKADIVIGSRYVEGGSVGDWNSRRLWMSKFAARLSNFVVKTEITDPMSGYFMVTRPAFEGSMRNLSGQGFKILLDIFASSEKPLRAVELPYTFGLRQHGESKVDTTVLMDFAYMLIDKLTKGYVSPRLVLFSMVGGFGLLVHFLVLSISMFGVGAKFATAQMAASLIAMTTNFAMNNELTYSDRKLRGGKFFVGLLSFYAICMVGVVGNVGIANQLFKNDYSWWLAALAGIAIGTAWNYTISSAVTWRKK
jgi:dolichol-phosphate mannosyltransferase